MSETTREKLCAAALALLDGPEGAAAVSMRRVAAKVGLTPMAIYKHFPSRNALLREATAAEYRRIAGYFQRANARKDLSGLRGMLGYLDYALDHPHLFQYMFSSQRKDMLTFPLGLNSGKSPTLNILHSFVGAAMEKGSFRKDDIFETSLTIWSHAHGLITLYLASRIELPRNEFRDLYLRSLDRLLHGLRNGGTRGFKD